jgi:hypothetical protein
VARLQVVHTEAAGSSGTIAQAITGVVAGSTLVICTGHANAGQLITGVASDVSGAAVQAQHSVYTGNQVADIWYIKNVAGGSHTITTTYASSVTDRFITVIEIQANTAAPLDIARGQDTGDSPTPTTPSGTTSTNGQYCVAVAVATPGTSLTAAAPYADVFAPVAVGSALLGIEDRIQASAGATNGAWTSANSSYCAALATFKAAGGGPMFRGS